MGAEVVVTITATRSMTDLVEDYLFARVPELATMDASVRLRTEGARLIVSVASPGRVKPHLNRLNDRTTNLLGPLSRILPFDIIEVELADSP